MRTQENMWACTHGIVTLRLCVPQIISLAPAYAALSTPGLHKGDTLINLNYTQPLKHNSNILISSQATNSPH